MCLCLCVCVGGVRGEVQGTLQLSELLLNSLRREFILSTNLHNCFDCDSSVEHFALLVEKKGSEKTRNLLMLWRALHARSMILGSVGFDSSLPKPSSSGLLTCLRHVSAFSSLFVPFHNPCIFERMGVLWVYVLPLVNPKDSSGWIVCRSVF